ncbi:2,3-bisphosphoglycerate-independent phosphoglycerate mutase [Candidatus Woesearchaeota archaeon]|nr:MAG: 2,3-bisphosphoglycerate-independent phosphoglycerate mutase [Candidatus Woesearchaeota archaeon]
MGKPTVLVILDGYGISEHKEFNATALAKTPNIDALIKKYPNTTLKASEEHVGLIKGQSGSSEAGHLNLGTGRVIEQDLSVINNAIAKGTFFTHPHFLELTKYVKENNCSLHFIGMLSDGGIHSHISHLFALLEFAQHHFLDKVYLHLFLDGRDVEPQSAKKYLRMLEKQREKAGTSTVATIIGRYYAMDSSGNYARTRKAYDMLVKGRGILIRDPMEAVNSAYRRRLSDEFVEPTIINQGGLIKEGDAVVYFNFKSERSKQLIRALTDPKFRDFPVKKLNLNLVSLAEVDPHYNLKIAFPSPIIKNSLGEVLAGKKIKQLRIAETEKFAYVTTYFNGGMEKPFPKEDRIHIKSPAIQHYDTKPEMSAKKITDKVIECLKRNKYDFYVVNLCNCDLVGHTGKLKETIKAVETVDKCVGKIVEIVEKKKGIAIITADHGNAEEKQDKFGRPLTSHTLNPVPLIVTKKGKLKTGKLADVAPTILKLMNIKPPKEMTGKSLF